MDLAYEQEEGGTLDTAMESNTAETKQRHGCLTAWLIVMIIANSLFALIYLIASTKIRSNLTKAPPWTAAALAVVCIANLIFSVALFQWKKWGFFGHVGTTILIVVINLKAGISISRVLFGMLGVVALYGVLQIGKANKGWPQLE